MADRKAVFNGVKLMIEKKWSGLLLTLVDLLQFNYTLSKLELADRN